MTPQELEQHRDALREGTTIDTTTLPSGEQILVINGLAALRIQPTNRYTSEDGVYDIPLHLDGEEIGTLCLISQIPRSDEVIPSLTDAQYAAYICLTEPTSFISGGWPSFAYDCVTIKPQSLEKYYQNHLSSPLWGGYSHATESQAIIDQKISSKDANINIYENCTARTRRHQDCLELAARAQHSTERYLHLYHYLELDYDYEVVKGIKALQEDDPQSLWDILKLTRDDIDRIFHILKDYDNFSEIERLAMLLREHESAAVRIFYDYGKDSNPLKDITAFREQFIASPSINRTELDHIKKNKGLQDNFCSTEELYRSKLLKLTCYWIYRVRCSIAHNKLGEYHLNQSDDMNFLVGFAEPLLAEMVRFRMSRR